MRFKDFILDENLWGDIPGLPGWKPSENLFNGGANAALRSMSSNQSGSSGGGSMPMGQAPMMPQQKKMMKKKMKKR